ncbi:hypothetical protein RYX36_002642, partial [Vicia faba]
MKRKGDDGEISGAKEGAIKFYKGKERCSSLCKAKTPEEQTKEKNLLNTAIVAKCYFYLRFCDSFNQNASIRNISKQSINTLVNDA